MRRHRALGASLLLLAAATACATPFGGGSARMMREQADAALRAGDDEAAYRSLAAIRREHSGSRESSEAFPLAARIFKHEYYRHRITQPASPWVTSEPGFMLSWLASFFDQETFPQEQVDALLRGMPVDFTTRFVADNRGRPEVARWELLTSDDDGIVQSVRPRRAASGAPSNPPVSAPR